MEMGMLMVGSVYWDDGQRQAWRELRLRQDDEFDVRAPIRYGRQSHSRGDTYTMVFSGGCQLGQAKLIRCKNIATSAADIVSESRHLWSAESAPSGGRFSASWGCVAVQARPGAD